MGQHNPSKDPQSRVFSEVFLFFLLQLRLTFHAFFSSPSSFSSLGSLSSSLTFLSSLPCTPTSLTQEIYFKAKTCPQQLTGFYKQPCLSRAGIATSECILHFCVSVDIFISSSAFLFISTFFMNLPIAYVCTCVHHDWMCAEARGWVSSSTTLHCFLKKRFLLFELMCMCV